MVTNLNKTKNPPQKQTFETSYSTRGTTQITENISVTFRAPTSPLPLRSITEGVYSAQAFRSSDSEGISHWKDWPLPRTTRQLSVQLHIPTVFVIVVFVLFKFLYILARQSTKVKSFFKKFLFAVFGCLHSCRK